MPVSEEREAAANIAAVGVVEGGLRIGNLHELAPGTDHNKHKWTMFVRAANGTSLDQVVEYVDFELHPTFDPPTIRVTKPPYSIRRLGWGTFEVTVRITWKTQLGIPPSTFTHMLRFSQPETSKVVTPIYQDKDTDSEIEVDENSTSEKDGDLFF